MARNAQVINAMGMIPEGVQMWGRETVRVPEGAGDRAGPQHPDDRLLEVHAAVHPDRHPRLGRMAFAGRRMSPAAW